MRHVLTDRGVLVVCFIAGGVMTTITGFFYDRLAAILAPFIFGN